MNEIFECFQRAKIGFAVLKVVLFALFGEGIVPSVHARAALPRIGLDLPLFEEPLHHHEKGGIRDPDLPSAAFGDALDEAVELVVPLKKKRADDDLRIALDEFARLHHRHLLMSFS